MVAIKRQGEAGVVPRRRNAPAGRAAIENLQPLRVAVFHIRYDGETRAIGETSVAIDLAFQIGRDRENGVSKSIALDEIVRHLVERAVQIVVRRYVVMKGADENLPVSMLIAIDGKARTFADENTAVADGCRHEHVGRYYRFVENVVK